MNNILSKFKGVLLLTVGLALFPSLANASMLPMDYPWPWPWALPCPIAWADLAGSHNVANGVVPGDQFSFELTRKVSRTREGDLLVSYRVHVRRTDNLGVHSDGTAKTVAELKRTFAVTMMSYRPGGRSYVIQVQMGDYQTRKTPVSPDQCTPDRVRTVVTINPDTPAGTNFYMDPAGQKFR